MTAIDEGLRQLLLAQSSITDLLSATTAFPGIYSDTVLKDAGRPLIVLSKLRTEPFNTLDGLAGTEAADFDIDCKANTRIRAEQVSAAVKAFLRNYTGAAGDATIRAVLWNDTTTRFEPDDQGGGTGEFVSTLDVTIQHTG